jgi:hypothetical protein
MKIVFALFLLSSLSVKGQQLINADFEQWGDSSKKHLPVNWSPDMIASLWNSPSTNSQHGKYALVLSTWYNYVEGHLHYGKFHEPYLNWTEYTVPFTGKPLKLTGYYRYTDPVNFTDSAGGQILLKDNKGDTLAYGSVLLDTAINWTRFEISLTYYSDKEARSIAIHFVSRMNGSGMNRESYPNKLYLDNFQLLYKKQD